MIAIIEIAVIYFTGFFISLIFWDFDDSPIPLVWPIALMLFCGAVPFVLFIKAARKVRKFYLTGFKKWEEK